MPLGLLVGLATLLIGFYDGLIGPGTGALFMFVLIRMIGLDFIHASGNTKVLNLTSNFVALCFFLYQGTISFSIGVPMAIANLAGGHFGARFAIKKGSGWVRWIFIAMAAALALKLLIT